MDRGDARTAAAQSVRVLQVGGAAGFDGGYDRAAELLCRRVSEAAVTVSGHSVRPVCCAGGRLT
eukprot:1371146-Rhodomonas_salina.1